MPCLVTMLGCFCERYKYSSSWQSLFCWYPNQDIIWRREGSKRSEFHVAAKFIREQDLMRLTSLLELYEVLFAAEAAPTLHVSHLLSGHRQYCVFYIISIA